MNCPHCNTHIDEHEASPCFDAWVAEAVMGWTVEVDESLGAYWYKNNSLFSADIDQYPHNTSSWCPSRHIAAAWEVHEIACNWIFSKRAEYFRGLQRSVSAREYPRGQFLWPDVMLFLKPEDFCRAAINAEKSHRRELEDGST